MTSAGRYEFLIGLLAAILLLELVARRLKLPPAAAFILGGTGLALLPGLPSFSLDPELVLVVFLPPLLMNGGYHTAWAEFRQNLGSITLLAVGAVIFTTAAVGLAAHAVVPSLPLSVCFALGAVLSPPDAVAASAILQRLSLPARLTATLEGESLLKDASGLVLFRLAVAAALTGSFDLVSAGFGFVILVAGGLLFGFAVGHGGLAVLRRLRDSELAILTTLLLPAVAYVGGESLHVSGVLATVVAGLILGRHQHRILSASTRIKSQAFWRVLIFLLESVLFILVGLALRDVLPRIDRLPHAGSSIWFPVALVVAVMIGSRFLWMMGTYVVRHLLRAAGLKRIPRPSLAVATIMSWAGMRGVVTLAAALSIPDSVPGRDFVLVASFTAILVSVLLQGTTLAPLIRLLRVSGAAELAARQDSADVAWARMMGAQYSAISAVSRQDGGGERHPRLVEQYGRRAAQAEEFLSDKETHRAIKVEHHAAVLSAIEAGRTEILRMHSSGDIHDEVLRALERELDLQQLVAEGHAD